MSAEPGRAGAVAAVQAIVEREGEADEILRQVVAEIAGRFGCFCGIRFVEEGDWVLGPSSGSFAGAETGVPVFFDRIPVAELVLAGTEVAEDERAALAQIGESLSVYCLVGWDTGGESWEP